MSIRALSDARDQRVFMIETGAVRYIRAIGSAAWTIYTYLVYCASQAGRPLRLPAASSIAAACGLRESEVEQAIARLLHYGLLDIKDEPRAGGESTIQLYRIVSQDRAPKTEQMPEVEPEPAAEEVQDESQVLRQMFDAMMAVSEMDEHELSDDVREDVRNAVAAIREAGGDADQIKIAAQIYRRAIPDLPLTPRGLVASWELLSSVFPTEEDQGAS